jgi:hypothetical protein
MRNLQVLELGHTPVTDSGLEYLKELSKLQTLDLWATAVTDQGMEKLRHALPACNISNAKL